MGWSYKTREGTGIQLSEVEGEKKERGAENHLQTEKTRQPILFPTAKRSGRSNITAAKKGRDKKKGGGPHKQGMINLSPENKRTRGFLDGGATFSTGKESLTNYKKGMTNISGKQIRTGSSQREKDPKEGGGGGVPTKTQQVSLLVGKALLTAGESKEDHSILLPLQESTADQDPKCKGDLQKSPGKAQIRGRGWRRVKVG